jgi:nitroreductase
VASVLKEEKLGVFETIKRRRSIRKYTEEPVSENLILEILEAGRWAPSAGNSQPWSFIVLRNGEVRRKIADATTTGKFLANAPIGIAVVIDPAASKHPVEDGSIATENMLLAAHALGLGACWIGAYNSVYEKRVKEVLGVPEDKRLLSIISIGFPAQSSLKTRKELGEIMFTDRYGKK